MQVVNVQVVGLQALETLPHGAQDGGPGETALVRAFTHLAADLAGQDELVPLAPERLPEHLFGDAMLVDVGSVKEVDACLQAIVNHALCHLLIYLATKGHRAEASTGDIEISSFELSVQHGLSSSSEN